MVWVFGELFLCVFVVFGFVLVYLSFGGVVVDVFGFYFWGEAGRPSPF